MCAHCHVMPLGRKKISVRTSLKRNPPNSVNIILLDVNFENLNVELRVLIISSMFAKFQEDQRLIVMLSIKCLNLKFLSDREQPMTLALIPFVRP